MPVLETLDVAAPYKLVRARHGWFLVNPGDVYIGRALLEYGEYAELEWALLEQVLPPGRDVIEVGANIGAHSVSLATLLATRGRRLLAIEPQPVVFQNLCANLALNALFNVRAESCACTDSAGWLSIPTLDHRREHNFGGVSMRPADAGGERVRGVPLDDLMDKSWKPGLVKIDVEGFEQKVLAGATRTLARWRPLVYLENDRPEQSRELIEWLWGHDYALWWHIPRNFNPDNFAQRSDNLYGQVGSFNMLGVPREVPAAIAGLAAVERADWHPLQGAAKA